MFEKLRRRSYLGGMVAAMAGLAGCGEDESQAETDTAADRGERTRAADTATETDTTQGEHSAETGIPRHDHSSETAGGTSLSPTEVNGDIYAARMPGADLSEKVRNAVDAVPAGGAVVVTPRPDGEAWTWDSTLRINLNETGGLQLLFRGTTMVEYTGDGYAIETTYRPAEYGALERGDFLRLRGGNWRAPEGNDPDGWLRMVDTNFCEVRPERVIDFSNDEGTGTGIRVEIQEIFSESNVFSGHFSHCDIGMDFVPSDTPGIAGGKAAASFQGTYVDNVKLLNCRRYGIRWRDGSQCQAMTVVAPDAFAGLTDVADEFVYYYLGGDFDEAVILGPKAEDGGAAQSERNDKTDTMFKLPEALGTPPLVIAPHNARNVDRLVDRADRFKTLPTLMLWKDGFRWQAGVHDLGRRDEEPFFHRGGVDFPATDLQTNFEGFLRNGHTVYYDGSADGVPEGLYRADPENSQWVKVEDNSVTVPV